MASPFTLQALLKRHHDAVIVLLALATALLGVLGSVFPFGSTIGLVTLAVVGVIGAFMAPVEAKDKQP